MKKNVFSLIFIFVCFLSLLPKLSAATIGPVYGHKMTGGIGNVSIYIDNRTHPYATYYERLIKIAVKNWDNTGYGTNKFNYVFVGSNNGSKVDMYSHYGSYFGSGASTTLAGTAFYSASEVKVNQYSSDWYSATIHLNDDVLSMDAISNEEATATFIHEFGHAFGLAHNDSNKYSIMCRNSYGRKVSTVQLIDHNTLNSIY